MKNCRLHWMFNVAWFFVLSPVVCAVSQEVDWTPLFDGRTLDGWVQKGGQANYSVDNGEIVGTTVPNTPNSFLCTERNYGDFMLSIEFRVDPELNSGVQIRSQSLPDYKNGRVHGYQVEIDASDRAWTGGIYDESRRGWINDLQTNAAARYAFKQNQWNHLLVVANGDRIRTWLNGVAAADLQDDKTASGFIALQVHGVGGRKDPIQVRWRNIKITEEKNSFRSVEPTSASEFTGPFVKAGAEVKKVAGGFEFAEGPSLSPDGKIYFSDIRAAKVHVFDPGNGETTVFRSESGRTNGTMWTPNDAIVCCEGGARRVTRIEPGQPPQVLASSYDGKKLNSPNDLELDGIGGIYFTDPRYGDRSDMELDVEGVYYLNRQRKITRIADDIQRPNGIALSLKNDALYVADTGDQAIWKYDVTGPGKIGNKTKLIAMGSDGMTLDEYGNLYLTNGNFVHIYSPDGVALEKIEFPEKPANVTFGGEQSSTIYVTARTSLYSVDLNVSGARAFANPD